MSFVGDSALRARGSTKITYHISLVATRTVHFACTPLLIHFYVIYFVEPLRLYLEVFLLCWPRPLGLGLLVASPCRWARPWGGGSGLVKGHLVRCSNHYLFCNGATLWLKLLLVTQRSFLEFVVQCVGKALPLHELRTHSANT